MSTDDATRARRLEALGLAGPGARKPWEATRLLAGVQAQDYQGGLWSIGLRTPGSTSAEVQAAVKARRIVRTWAFRGTLHFVAAADVRWVTALLAPSIIAANGRRYGQLGLDQRAFEKSRRLIAAALQGGPGLTRAGLAEALERGGVSAAGQRAPYLLQRAALDCLICQRGLGDGSEPLYVLLEEWVPRRAPRGAPRGGPAHAELARRYFAGHGPASLRDFVWWSGLPAARAREGLEAAAPSLERVAADLWAAPAPLPRPDPPAAVLLPPFDEVLLGYRDRELWLDPSRARAVNAGGGMPRPTVLLDGRVAGTWSRRLTTKGLEVEARLFSRPGRRQAVAVEQAAARLAAFIGAPLQLVRTLPLATSQSRASRTAARDE